MKTILISHTIGVDPDPKERNEWYNTDIGKLFYVGINTWLRMYLLRTVPAEPKYWYKEVSKEEYDTRLITEGFEAARLWHPLAGTKFDEAQDYLNTRGK